MIALLALAATAVPAQADDKKAAAAHVYGPPPTWEAYRQLAEGALANRLVDPESARFSWTGQYHKGEFKPLLMARVRGYIGCGTVNARNRVGGYTGATSFVVVIDFDRALFADFDTRPGGMLSEQCAAGVRAGLFAPLPAAVDSAPSVAAATPSPLGLSVRAMPEGAYVATVQPGSAAAAAGLAPGMVVTTINGIPLAGMGEAQGKIVAAAGPGATLVLVGGKTILIGARP